MSDCQKAGSRASLTGRAYAAILPIFDGIPDRFELKEVMRAGKIPRYLDGAVKNVLENTFRCRQVGERVSTWKKP